MHLTSDLERDSVSYERSGERERETERERECVHLTASTQLYFISSPLSSSSRGRACRGLGAAMVDMQKLWLGNIEHGTPGVVVRSWFEDEGCTGISHIRMFHKQNQLSCAIVRLVRERDPSHLRYEHRQGEGAMGLGG